MSGFAIKLHAMAHVEDLVQFLPIGSAGFTDHVKERRNGEKLVFDHMQTVDKMQHLCLCTAAAMHDAVNVLSHFGQHLADDRRIGPGR